jgi:hypothetical protein
MSAHEPGESLGPGDQSPDGNDRVEEFLARHGGPGTRETDIGSDPVGQSGWSVVYAADGYTLRCDWSRTGELQRMKFTERPPADPR